MALFIRVYLIVTCVDVCCHLTKCVCIAIRRRGWYSSLDTQRSISHQLILCASVYWSIITLLVFLLQLINKFVKQFMTMLCLHSDTNKMFLLKINARDCFVWNTLAVSVVVVCFFFQVYSFTVQPHFLLHSTLTMTLTLHINICSIELK